MPRTAVCIDDTPTFPYSDRLLSFGKEYQVEDVPGPGNMVRVLNPDPERIFRLVKTEDGGEIRNRRFVLGETRKVTDAGPHPEGQNFSLRTPFQITGLFDESPRTPYICGGERFR